MLRFLIERFKRWKWSQYRSIIVNSSKSSKLDSKKSLSRQKCSFSGIIAEFTYAVWQQTSRTEGSNSILQEMRPYTVKKL